MGKHSSDETADINTYGTGTRGRHVTSNAQDDPNREGSFFVNSPERVARGVGDRQTGGRED
jgi:hypothetical protein